MDTLADLVESGLGKIPGLAFAGPQGDAMKSVVTVQKTSHDNVAPPINSVNVCCSTRTGCCISNMSTVTLKCRLCAAEEHKVGTSAARHADEDKR